MEIKNTDRFINATLVEGKKEALKGWLLSNVFTPGRKWVSQKQMFDLIKAAPAVADLASPGLVNDAIAELRAENKLLGWLDGFPPAA